MILGFSEFVLINEVRCLYWLLLYWCVQLQLDLCRGLGFLTETGHICSWLRAAPSNLMQLMLTQTTLTASARSTLLYWCVQLQWVQRSDSEFRQLMSIRLVRGSSFLTFYSLRSDLGQHNRVYYSSDNRSSLCKSSGFSHLTLKERKLSPKTSEVKSVQFVFSNKLYSFDVDPKRRFVNPIPTVNQRRDYSQCDQRWSLSYLSVQ
jgi:hypothetical protein